METAVFGGSFNPPTKAHQAIIAACLEYPSIEKVWVMPSGDRFDKRYDVADQDRLAMLRLMKEEAFAGDERVVISDFELHLPRPTQTWRTVEALQRLHPKHHFWFVYGADAYHAMPSWQKGCELQTTLSMLLIARSGIALPDAPNVRPLPVQTGELSSTLVRERAAAGQDIGGYVCGAVAAYILRRSLYAGTLQAQPVQC